MAFHQFNNTDGEAYGSFETFYLHVGDDSFINDDGEPLLAGWYWWACFPGCMPDGEPCGPFDTQQDAINHARSILNIKQRRSK